MSIRKRQPLQCGGPCRAHLEDGAPFTSATHDDYHCDPQRHIPPGQRGAFRRAADGRRGGKRAAAEEGCRRVEIEYEVLPAVFDPEAAMQTGAPVLHDKGAESRIRRPGQNILPTSTAVWATSRSALPRRRSSTRARMTRSGSSTRILRPIAQSRGWMRRTACTSGPVRRRRTLPSRNSASFDLYPDSVHVFCERVGGGFGGKQEVLTEDICVAATLKTGRPVKLEFTREEHHGCDHAPSHGRPHQGRARRDGTLTAIQMRVVSNTGAYGNHGGETLYAACGEAIAVYRCPNKRWMRMRCTPTRCLLARSAATA